MTKSKKIPSIISHSRYGRPRRGAKKIQVDNDDDTTEEEDQSLSCPFCGRPYAHIKARNKHMVNDHLKECKEEGCYFPCESCSGIFVSMLGKDKHVKRIHPQTFTAKVSDDAILCPFNHLKGEKEVTFEK